MESSTVNIKGILVESAPARVKGVSMDSLNPLRDRLIKKGISVVRHISFWSEGCVWGGGVDSFTASVTDNNGVSHSKLFKMSNYVGGKEPTGDELANMEAIAMELLGKYLPKEE